MNINPTILTVITLIWAALGAVILLFGAIKRKQLPTAVAAAFIVFGILVICSGTLIFIGLRGTLA